ncbi:MAG: hypothetical protein WCC38_04420 [Pseudonocardiaceae bacterium]
MTWTGESTDVELDDRCIAELVTHALCDLHSAQGGFVRLKATLGDDGYITVDVTRINFTGEDATVRVLLHLTTPVTVTSPPRTQIHPGSSAA